MAKGRAYEDLYARSETKKGTDWLGRETKPRKMYST